MGSILIDCNVADQHGSTKVDFWKQPTNPGNWKEEHVRVFHISSLLLLLLLVIDSFSDEKPRNLQFVLISLSGWGLLFYSGYKLFTGGKGEEVIYLLLLLSLPP